MKIKRIKLNENKINLNNLGRKPNVEELITCLHIFIFFPRQYDALYLAVVLILFQPFPDRPQGHTEYNRVIYMLIVDC